MGWRPRLGPVVEFPFVPVFLGLGEVGVEKHGSLLWGRRRRGGRGTAFGDRGPLGPETGRSKLIEGTTSSGDRAFESGLREEVMLSQRTGSSKARPDARRSTSCRRGRRLRIRRRPRREVRALRTSSRWTAEGQRRCPRRSGGAGRRWPGRPVRGRRPPGPAPFRRRRRRPPPSGRGAARIFASSAAPSGPAARSAGGRTTVLSSILSGRMRAMAFWRARMSAGESLTPLTSMISSRISPANSSRKRTRPSMIFRLSSEAWGRLTRRKRAAGTASSEGTTMSAAARSRRTSFRPRSVAVGQDGDGDAGHLLDGPDEAADVPAERRLARAREGDDVDPLPGVQGRLDLGQDLLRAGTSCLGGSWSSRPTRAGSRRSRACRS